MERDLSRNEFLIEDGHIPADVRAEEIYTYEQALLTFRKEVKALFWEFNDVHTSKRSDIKDTLAWVDDIITDCFHKAGPR
jgi:hypothetical protein